MSNNLFDLLSQQSSTQRVSGEDLEVFGKHAAQLWRAGEAPTLSDAVITSVKTAHLSPEQVKRVVEFANTDAFLVEFKKEGSHHVVHFDGGPADPGAVLQSLNSGTGVVTYEGPDDYSRAPQRKEASAFEETMLKQAFCGVNPEVELLEDPFLEVERLRTKLAGIQDQVVYELTAMESAYRGLKEELTHHIKQAALDGHSLSEIVQIWQGAAPDVYVKVAFSAILPDLLKQGVFEDHDSVVASLTKEAHIIGDVNPEHPLITEFNDFCVVLTKLGELRQYQQELVDGVSELDQFLKVADGGLFDKAHHGVKWLASRAERGGQALGHAVAGKRIVNGVEHTGALAHGLGLAAKGAVYAAPVLGAHEVYRQNLKYNPTYEKAKNLTVGLIPGTNRYNQREYEAQARAQGML